MSSIGFIPVSPPAGRVPKPDFEVTGRLAVSRISVSKTSNLYVYSTTPITLTLQSKTYNLDMVTADQRTCRLYAKYVSSDGGSVVWIPVGPNGELQLDEIVDYCTVQPGIGINLGSGGTIELYDCDVTRRSERVYSYTLPSEEWIPTYIFVWVLHNSYYFGPLDQLYYLAAFTLRGDFMLVDMRSGEVLASDSFNPPVGYLPSVFTPTYDISTRTVVVTASFKYLAVGGGGDIKNYYYLRVGQLTHKNALDRLLGSCTSANPLIIDGVPFEDTLLDKQCKRGVDVVDRSGAYVDGESIVYQYRGEWYRATLPVRFAGYNIYIYDLPDGYKCLYINKLKQPIINGDLTHEEYSTAKLRLPG